VVVRDRGGDSDEKDNSDWWKVTKARIIRRLQASYSARGTTANSAVGERARCLGISVKLSGLAQRIALS